MVKKIGWGVSISALLFIGSAFVQPPPLSKSIQKGKEVYTAFCLNCHMADGKGQAGVFPPLAKADYIKKPVKVLVDVILKGQGGELTVNGIKYNGQMPSQSYLTDEQIADVINYMKNSWGNRSAQMVTPALVKKMRN